MSAYIASPQKFWILDSKGSSYMTSIKQKFISLNLSNKFSYINIADTQSPILGNEVFQDTPSLTLTDVLYISKFLVSLSSINQFTKHNNRKITFPFPLSFSGPVDWEENWLGHERGSMYNLNDRVNPTGLVAGQPDHVLL